MILSKGYSSGRQVTYVNTLNASNHRCFIIIVINGISVLDYWNWQWTLPLNRDDGMEDHSVFILLSVRQPSVCTDLMGKNFVVQTGNIVSRFQLCIPCNRNIFLFKKIRVFIIYYSKTYKFVQVFFDSLFRSLGK